MSCLFLLIVLLTGIACFRLFQAKKYWWWLGFIPLGVGILIESSQVLGGNLTCAFGLEIIISGVLIAISLIHPENPVTIAPRETEPEDLKEEPVIFGGEFEPLASGDSDHDDLVISC